MATIKEIAEKAGVSTAAVSMVLNNRKGVGEDTKNRILKIVEELNYNLPANSKQKKKSETIQFIRISKHGHTVNRDHSVFISEYIDGLTEVCRMSKYNLEIIAYEHIKISKIIENLKQARFSGAIILGTELEADDIDLFNELDYPIVFMDTCFSNKKFDFIDMDNKDAVYAVIEEFINNGHTKISIVNTYVSVENFKERYSGYINCIRNNPHIIEYPEINVDSTFDGAYKGLKKYIEEGNDLPTGLFCVNDIIALGCMKALAEKNILIPNDVSIIGFDNLPQTEMTSPQLTTINVQKKRIGAAAMKTLIDRIEVETDSPPIKISIGAQLIKRSSVFNYRK